VSERVYIKFKRGDDACFRCDTFDEAFELAQKYVSDGTVASVRFETDDDAGPGASNVGFLPGDGRRGAIVYGKEYKVRP
jgi:hypothetical protein